MLPLRELQLRFRAALAAGLGEPDATVAPADPVLLGAIAARAALGAAPRLRIYQDMYRARLTDVLREDFPRVVAILGDETFEALAARYLAAHPSAHPSVRHVGDRFADFVGRARPDPPFLPDLARLEWARVEVFDAADAEPLMLSDLQAIAAERWPALDLHAIPASRLLRCTWPAHEIWASPDRWIPGHAPPWEPRPVAIRVWREGDDVSHAAIGALEGRLFPLLERGAPLSALCAALVDDLEPEAAAREVGGLLMRWLEDGFLARCPCVIPTPSPALAPQGGDR
jgi:hypothetical protein